VPIPPVRASRLSAVQALPSGQAWAVGTTYKDVDGRGPSYGLIEHWDGVAWRVVPSPVRGGEWGLFNLTVDAEGALWAVGSTVGASPDHTLFLRWDGVEWRIVVSPVLGSFPGDHGLVSSGSTVWFAGTTEVGGVGHPLVLRTCP
jgi:hypothetical protein